MSKRLPSKTSRPRKRTLGDLSSKKAQDLWLAGGPLHGFKNIPWAISTVGTDGRTFTVKAFMRDEERREENMVLRLIALIGWPRPPPATNKMDAFYPDFALFFECHEMQHVDPTHIHNVHRPGGYAAQQAADLRKCTELVAQGYYGIVIAAFDGPFAGGHWTAVTNAEVRWRTSLAVQTLAQARAENYARGDYAGRMMLFSSPVTDANPTATDGLRIGARFLSFDAIDDAGRRAAAAFPAERVRDLAAAQAALVAAIAARAATAAVVAAAGDSGSSDDNVAAAASSSDSDNDLDLVGARLAATNLAAAAPPACAFCGSGVASEAVVWPGMDAAPVCARDCAGLAVLGTVGGDR